MEQVNEILKKASTAEGKRKKIAFKNISFQKLSRSTAYNATLVAIRESLQQAVNFTFSKEYFVTYVHADASEEFWDGKKTQN